MGETHAEMRTLQLATIAGAKQRVPRRTGHLGRSIVPGRVTDKIAVVEARTPYASTVEFGSKPHIIKPKKAKVLAWGGDRRLSGALRRGAKATHFAKVVHHPGTRPYPYLVPAAKQAANGLKDILVKAWNGAA